MGNKDTGTFEIPRPPPSLIAILGLFAGSWGAVYSTILIPYRLEAAEKAQAADAAEISELQKDGAKRAETYSRLDEHVLDLDERIAQLQEQLGYPSPTPLPSRSVRPSAQ